MLTDINTLTDDEVDRLFEMMVPGFAAGLEALGANAGGRRLSAAEIQAELQQDEMCGAMGAAIREMHADAGRLGGSAAIEQLFVLVAVLRSNYALLADRQLINDVMIARLAALIEPQKPTVAVGDDEEALLQNAGSQPSPRRPSRALLTNFLLDLVRRIPRITRPEALAAAKLRFPDHSISDDKFWREIWSAVPHRRRGENARTLKARTKSE